MLIWYLVVAGVAAVVSGAGSLWVIIGAAICFIVVAGNAITRGEKKTLRKQKQGAYKQNARI